MNKQPKWQQLAMAIALTLSFNPLSASADVAPPDQQPSAPGPTEAASQGMLLPGFEWALPCESKLNSAGQRVCTTASGKRLSGSVTQWDLDGDFGKLVDTLLDGSLAGRKDAAKLDRDVAHYRQHRQELISDAKDAANYLIPYRGFGPSSEAADVILDEKIKIKDKASAEYARQRLIDQVHPQVVAKLMQLAMAVGTKDPVKHDEMVGNAMGSLEQLVGKQRAQLALNKMEEWSKLHVPETAYRGTADWDVEIFQTKLKEVTKLAMDGDPVMQEIVRRLQKYNHHSKASLIASHVITGGLSIASWAAPGYAIPLALELINAGYVMATGGPEESKLIKELYYDKRVESRYRTVNEEAQMAMTQYQNAANQHNPVLLACCESVITQLVGVENISNVLGRTLLAHAVGDVKPMTASSQDQSLQ